MAFGNTYSWPKLKGSFAGFNGEDELELGFVKYTGGLGKKRIVISNDLAESSTPIDSIAQTPSKRQRSEKMMLFGDSCIEKSALESLPQDVLIRILCGADHDDLKQLFNVSKSIREAAVIAKESHFAFSTPTKTRAFRTPVDLQGLEDGETEPPKAPRQRRSGRPALNRKSLADISVVLFG